MSNTDLIPVPAAFFSSISINIASGEYTFIQIPPVSIVGDGVGGWPPFVGNDPNQLSSTDGVNYKLDKLACTVGSAKFRQDNAWTINWGNAALRTTMPTDALARLMTALVEEAAAASESLHAQAEQLGRLIEFFRVSGGR